MAVFQLIVRKSDNVVLGHRSGRSATDFPPASPKRTVTVTEAEFGDMVATKRLKFGNGGGPRFKHYEASAPGPGGVTGFVEQTEARPILTMDALPPDLEVGPGPATVVTLRMRDRVSRAILDGTGGTTAFTRVVNVPVRYRTQGDSTVRLSFTDGTATINASRSKPYQMAFAGGPAFEVDGDVTVTIHGTGDLEP